MSFETDSLKNENLRLKNELKDERRLREQAERKPAQVVYKKDPVIGELESEVSRLSQQVKAERASHISELSDARAAIDKAQKELSAEKRKPCESCKTLAEERDKAQKELSAALQSVSKMSRKERDAQLVPGPSKHMDRLIKQNRQLSELLRANNGDSGKQ